MDFVVCGLFVVWVVEKMMSAFLGLLGVELFFNCDVYFIVLVVFIFVVVCIVIEMIVVYYFFGCFVVVCYEG